MDDLEILSRLAVFLMLLRGFRFTRFITACTIGLVRIERLQPGIGLLEVVAVSVYCFHTLKIVLRDISNCFVMLLLLIQTVRKETI